MDAARLERCREKLREMAAVGARITYGDLAAHLGIVAQGTSPYLQEIYEKETDANRPDLSLVVVSKDTGYGRYNAPSSGDTGFPVDPKNPAHVRAYLEQLDALYQYWRSK